MTVEADGSSEECVFNLQTVHDVFKSSLIGEDDVDLFYYLEGFKELRKFCDLMGSLFSFVSSEIAEKIQILEHLREGESKEHFSSLIKMTSYEINQNLLDKKHYVSGCRTLLRLHRGLDFIRTFLKKLGELRPNDSTNGIGREAYANTLASYHSFFIRQGAYLAMYTLPTQKVLLERVCKNRADEALSVLPAMLEVTNVVYDRIEAHFKSHNLLKLP